MPFRPDPFLRRFEPLRRLRRRPLLGYIIAVAAVGGSAAVRFAFGSLLEAVPFITYFPAIVVATAAGGARAGALAAVLSAVAANLLAFPPLLSVSSSLPDLVSTGLFLFVSAMMIVIITLLNQAIDRIWAQAENSRFILDAEPTGVIGVDADGRIKLVNAAVERQLGYRQDELIDRPVDLLVPAELRAAHDRHRQDFMARPEPRLMGAGRDLNAVARDGSLVPVEIGLNPIERDGVTGTLATIIDISERKSLEWRNQVLTNEVQHRARNLLAIIQAIAMRTLPGDEGKRFMGVLGALARNQADFGSEKVVQLRAIVERELAGFGDQVAISGCDVLLSARAGQDFALIVHELATNALKHGALSAQGGRVAIDGTVREDGSFVFAWEEEGGPAVEGGARQGFGQTILRDVARSFATDVRFELAASGLRYALTTRLDRISNLAELPVHTAKTG